MTRRVEALWVVVSLVVLSLSGCAPDAHEDPCAVREGEWSVVVDEIDAAARLNFDPSRAEALKAIAARPTLAPAEQEHLACTALRRVNFDPARQEILRALINNPRFSPRAKSYILRHLELINFDPARADLIREMQGRGDEIKPGYAE